MRHTIRYTLLSLSRAKAFSATVVVTLAIGIAATATLFTVTDRLLLSPAELNHALGDSLVSQGIIKNESSVQTYQGDDNIMYTPLNGTEPWLQLIDGDHSWRQDGLPVFCDFDKPSTCALGIGPDVPFQWVLALALGIGIGAGFGAIQGFIIAYVGVPSFIVTLGGLLSIRGLVWYQSQGAAVVGLEDCVDVVACTWPYDFTCTAVVVLCVPALVCARTLRAPWNLSRSRSRC